ncbi:MAG: hypothetical protein RLZZ59_837 [Pseudomonadota bacterium]|jgi:fatty acid desaturase
MKLDNTDTKYFKATTSIIKIVSLIIGVILIFLSQYGFMFYVAGMLPTIVVSFVDRKEEKCASATICTFNLIGVLPYLSQIWLSSPMDEASKLLISDITTWGVIYSAALVGQIVYWTVPIAFAKLYEIRAKVEISILDAQRAKLLADWNLSDKPLGKNAPEQ